MKPALAWETDEEPVSPSLVHDLGERLGVRLPSDFIDCMANHHGGSPSHWAFDMHRRKGMVLRSLLSMKRGGASEMPTIEEALGDLSGRLPARLIPFAEDAFGNVICLDFRGLGVPVAFWDHETERVTEVAPSFGEFLNLLYEPPPLSGDLMTEVEKNLARKGIGKAAARSQRKAATTRLKKKRTKKRTGGTEGD